MLPASNRGLGSNLCFPDVCATPPMGVPIPYPNLAMNAMAAPFAIKTFLTNVNALNLGSFISMTYGDQAGSMSPFMGPGQFTMGSPNVFVEGLPAIRLLSSATGNNMIAPLGAALYPSLTNVFFNHAAAPAVGDVSAKELSTLARAMSRVDDVEVVGCEGDEGMLRIRLFTTRLPSRAHMAIRRLRQAGAQRLLLDLRGCPGGDLHAALDLASDFLPEGTLLARLVDGDGDETEVVSRNPAPCDLPITLWVDGDTASAAEAFAGCLKLSGRATLRGSRTRGKGTVEAVLAGEEGRPARYASVLRVRLADGGEIEGQGICP